MRHVILLAVVALTGITVAIAQADPSADDYINIRVRRVSIEGTPALSPHQKNTLKSEIRKLGLNRLKENSQDNLRQESEELIREAYQNQGYFKAEVQTSIVVGRSSASHGSVDVLARVVPGLQYRMGVVKWKGVKRFTSEQLSALIPAHPGELFSRQVIDDGLQAIKSLYDSVGYINFTLIPLPEIDDARTVSFTMDVDEGGEFTLGRVVVSGFTQEQLDQLEASLLQLRGQPFSWGMRDKIDDRIRQLAPCNDKGDFDMLLSEKEQRVSFFYDYSDCYDSWLEALDKLPDPAN